MIEVHAKIGTGPGVYVVLRACPYDPGVELDDETGLAPLLEELPRLGDRVSWVELDCGPACTGIVDGIRGDLFLIARH